MLTWTLFQLSQNPDKLAKVTLSGFVSYMPPPLHLPPTLESKNYQFDLLLTKTQGKLAHTNLGEQGCFTCFAGLHLTHL
jgi:hypothetical protein